MGNAADETSAASFRLKLLILMVLQNSCTVLVGRYTRSSVKVEDAFVVTNFILVAEFTKIVLSSILEYHTTGGELLKSINDHIISQPLDFLRILIPALLYLLQNTLLYVALSNLSAPLFQVTYQGKLLTTALVSVILLNRRYKVRQWICLATLGGGVAIVVLGASSTKGEDESSSVNEQNMFVGLVSVTVACLSSAFAGVYFEKVLKKETVSTAQDSNPNPAPSLWMRNIQLAFFSVCTTLLQISLSPWLKTDYDATPNRNLFQGFTFWVWILVLLQAGGGLLVAAVIKYADNVLKGLATGVSVVLSTFCSMILFGTRLHGQFALGAVIILISVYFFSNDFSFGSTKEKDDDIIFKTEKEAEMKSMLPK